MKRMKISLALALAVVGATVTTATATSATRSNPSVLNGVYRIKWTEQELLAGGTSPLYARRNHGVDTLMLRDGRYLIRYSSPSGPDCRGAYKVSGKTFSLNFHVPTCPGGVGAITASWSLANSELRFRRVHATDSGDKVFWGGRPWKKIG